MGTGTTFSEVVRLEDEAISCRGLRKYFQAEKAVIKCNKDGSWNARVLRAG